MKQTSAKTITNVSEYSLPVVAFLISFVLMLINQGGFFNGGIIMGALAASVFLLFVNQRVSKKCLPFLLFSIWYFICSVRTGFVIENATRGILPLVLIALHQITTDKRFGFETARIWILKFSFFVAIVSVVICVVKTITVGSFIYAVYPFQYANTTGIYFAVCYVMSFYITDKLSGWYKSVFAIALLCTGSIGAVLLTYIATFLVIRNKKKFVVFTAALCVAAVVFRNEIMQSAATLLERLLQMRDGFFCMLQNPFFGIGAGKWETAKQVYQTGFYSAKVIHSSITQIGVDSGITGLLLFIFAVTIFFFSKKMKKQNRICFVMLLVHSLFDFSMSFLPICCMMLLCTEAEETRVIELKGSCSKILPLVIIVFCTVALVVFSMVSVMDKNAVVNQKTLQQVSKISNKAADRYMFELYKNGKNNEINELICSKEYLSTEEILLAIKISDDKNGTIKKYNKMQPFNVVLNDNLRISDNGEALKKMSYLAKKLYYLKGENR